MLCSIRGDAFISTKKKKQKAVDSLSLKRIRLDQRRLPENPGYRHKEVNLK